jgi:hypothetical protein
MRRNKTGAPSEHVEVGPRLASLPNDGYGLLCLGVLSGPGLVRRCKKTGGPLRRAQRPDRASVFLYSDTTRCVTGQLVHIDRSYMAPIWAPAFGFPGLLSQRRGQSLPQVALFGCKRHHSVAGPVRFRQKRKLLGPGSICLWRVLLKHPSSLDSVIEQRKIVTNYSKMDGRSGKEVPYLSAQAFIFYVDQVLPISSIHKNLCLYKTKKVGMNSFSSISMIIHILDKFADVFNRIFAESGYYLREALSLYACGQEGASDRQRRSNGNPPYEL